MTKKFKEIGAFRFGDEGIEVDSIPTGSIALDRAIGVGGIPRGRVIEIFGKEGSSKTTLCQHIVSCAQEMDLECAYVDMEHALDPKYMQATGVDIEKLWIVQPNTAEEALKAAEAFIKNGFGVVVVDSVAALVPRAELEGEAGDAHVALQARLMSQALRRLSPMLKKHQSNLIFTNQIRSTIGGFGSGTTTSGGRALPYYAAVRIETTHIGQIKEGQESIGSKVRARIVKNKVAPPYEVVTFPVRFGVGIDQAKETIDVAVEMGIVEKSHSWYTYEDIKSQGTSNFIEDLGERLSEIREKINES